ncbi:MAG: phosphate signaling complex protein PhoU [Bacillota bacterium]
MTSQRTSFEKELTELQHDILRMGSLVEEAVFSAVQALVTRDEVLAKKVVINDDQIDVLCREIENRCVRLIATQQPIARDLRIIITGIKIISNLERMGDHAVDIARYALNLIICYSSTVADMALQDISQIGKMVQQMVKNGLDAYVYDDVTKARVMSSEDDQVDHLYRKTFNAILDLMEKEPENTRCYVYLLLAALRLERVADRATNIGEDVIYLVTGEWEELN